jgi:hypothetical protein
MTRPYIKQGAIVPLVSGWFGGYLENSESVENYKHIQKLFSQLKLI